MKPKGTELLEKLDFLFGYDMRNSIVMYGMKTGELSKSDVTCWELRENVGADESCIIMFYETENELRIYDHELEEVFYCDNFFIMKYGDYLLISYVMVTDFIATLMERRDKDMLDNIIMGVYP